MAVTLGMLARQLGVDPSLVSRVLRDDPKARVSEAKRAQILELAASSGYRPNRIASSLRTRRTRILAMLTPDITNPFHSLLFRAVEAAARGAGYSVILCNTDDTGERFEQIVQVLEEGHVDGLLIATARSADPEIEALRASALPYVLLNRRREDGTDSWIGPDDEQSGRLGVAHLAALGHKRIAFAVGDLSVENMARRLAGYRTGMREHGLPVDEALVHSGNNERAQGRAWMSRLLALPAQKRPSAVLVTQTLVTDGVMSAIHAAGLRVPRDISVIGYSGADTPEITSICVPVDEIGRLATESLIARLQSGKEGAAVEDKPLRQTLAVRLVDMGSTDAPPEPAVRDNGA